MDAVFLISAFRKNQYPPPDRPEIAFAGRSNVGKSSLMNVLVNRKSLARTSSRPGRTQSINFFSVSNRLFFVDLPGYGYAKVPIKVKKSWQHMMETYLSERSNLRSVIVIFDIRRDPTGGDMQLLGWLKHYGIPAIPVLTKADKLSRQQTLTRSSLINNQIAESALTQPIVFSAKTRQGRHKIWEKIEEVIET